MKPIHIATSPLTNRILAGHVLKDGRTWGAGKQDVTGAACGAVCEYVIASGEPMYVTANGVPKFKITVEVLNEGIGEAADLAEARERELLAQRDELLAALKKADDALEFSGFKPDGHVRRNIKAAIAEATGGEL